MPKIVFNKGSLCVPFKTQEYGPLCPTISGMVRLPTREEIIKHMETVKSVGNNTQEQYEIKLKFYCEHIKSWDIEDAETGQWVDVSPDVIKPLPWPIQNQFEDIVLGYHPLVGVILGNSDSSSR